MERTSLLFLEILKNALNNTKTDFKEDISPDEWRALYRLSSIHEVVPLFAHTVYRCDSLKQHPKLLSSIVSRAKAIVINQAQRSANFAGLYQEMLDDDLKPLVMKGIICRSLYPEPEQRPSVDEDLLILPEQIKIYHQFLLSHGFSVIGDDIDLKEVDEISYQNKDTHLYLEIHKYLFPRNSSVFGDLNSFFGALEERKSETVYGTEFNTMGYTDHLLYMICHAYKHFLYSGFGIRQICDICLFTKAYGIQINWKRIYESCRSVRMEKFTAAVFKVCEKYLGLNSDDYAYKEIWDDDINEEPLLIDVLSGGLYGVSSEDRLHSSNLTLESVSASREGRKSRSLMRSVFPDLNYMSTNYPYLKEYRWLLPVAWIQRGYKYLSKKRKRKSSPTGSIEIGNSRIKILKEYHIID